MKIPILLKYLYQDIMKLRPITHLYPCYLQVTPHIFDHLYIYRDIKAGTAKKQHITKWDGYFGNEFDYSLPCLVFKSENRRLYGIVYSMNDAERISHYVLVDITDYFVKYDTTMIGHDTIQRLFKKNKYKIKIKWYNE